MNSKQKAIEKAYGDYYKICNPDENGWSIKRKGIGFEQLKKQIELEYDKPHNAYAFRPKSISGIENNNGWNKIESEDDLPKDTSVFYWCGLMNNNNDFYQHSAPKTCTFIIHENSLGYVNIYQPIEKPNPPIF